VFSEKGIIKFIFTSLEESEESQETSMNERAEVFLAFPVVLLYLQPK